MAWTFDDLSPAELRDRLLAQESSSLPLAQRWGLVGLRMVYAVGRDLVEGQLTLRAMSLVYTTLLSLVPLLAISFSILKGFGVHNQVEPFLTQLLQPLGARGPEIAGQVVSFVDNIEVGVLGSVGFVFLFYTVISLMQKIELAFNHVWQVAKERTWGERFKDYLSVIMVGPVLVFSSLGLTATIMNAPLVERISGVEPFGWLVALIGRLIPVLMIVLAFTFLYIFVPYTRVRLVPALCGGAVAGVLWHLVGWMFASFVVVTGRYTAIYSGFATPIFFMMWLYIGWLILLVGACIGFYLQHPEYIRGRRLASTLSHAERERLALQMLRTVGQRFYGGVRDEGDAPAGDAAGGTTGGAAAHRRRRGGPPRGVSSREMATDLGVPADVALSILDVLAERGLVARLADKEGGYVPGRPWETATVYEALDALRRTPGDGAGAARRRAGASVVDAVLSEDDRARRDHTAVLTLKEFALRETPVAAVASGPATSTTGG